MPILISLVRQVMSLPKCSSGVFIVRRLSDREDIEVMPALPASANEDQIDALKNEVSRQLASP